MKTAAMIISLTGIVVSIALCSALLCRAYPDCGYAIGWFGATVSMVSVYIIIQGDDRS